MDAITATTFFRHQRPLRALMIEGQAWFCVKDLGRLLGLPYPERRLHRLERDQHRDNWVKADGQWGKHLLVSECGALTLIVRNCPRSYPGKGQGRKSGGGRGGIETVAAAARLRWARRTLKVCSVAEGQRSLRQRLRVGVARESGVYP